PPPFALVPDSAPMQQQKTVDTRCRGISGIQPRDTVSGGGQQGFVAVDMLAVRVRPVREQGEMNVSLKAGEMVYLQLVDLLFDAFARRQQDRHGHQRSQRSWDAAAQFKRRKQGGSDRPRYAGVDQSNGRIERGDGTQQAKNGDPTGTKAHRR